MFSCKNSAKGYKKLSLMKTKFITLIIAVLCVLGASVYAESFNVHGRTVEVPDWAVKKCENKYHSIIAKETPTAESIIFFGSSTIEHWQRFGFSKTFAGLPVYNFGIGSTTTDQWIYLADKLVLPFAPKMVVYFCGTNDLSGGANVDAIIENIRLSFSLLKEKNPEVRIIFMSVTKVPSRQKRWADMDKINAAIEADAQNDKNLLFFDMNTLLLGKDGKIPPEFMEKDNLHLSLDGYNIISEKILPLVKEVWNEVAQK